MKGQLGRLGKLKIIGKGVRGGGNERRSSLSEKNVRKKESE